MQEEMSAAALKHRETDPMGSDFRAARKLEEREIIVKRVNGSTRALMIIGSSVISILLAVTAFMLGRDRKSIDQQIDELRAGRAQNQAAIILHSTELARMAATQDAMSKEISEIKKITDDNNALNRQMLAAMADIKKQLR